MKKLFPILTMALVIFAGSLSIETHAEELNTNDVLTAEEKITADGEKNNADAWLEGNRWRHAVYGQGIDRIQMDWHGS